jgi:hypothetical protein
MTTNAQMNAEQAISQIEEMALGETAFEIEVETSKENHRLATHMLSQAGRSLRIFTRELDPLIYDQTDFVEAAKQLALRSRFSRIEILAFESQRIIQRGHRLVSLARSLSSRIEIRRPDKQFENHLQTFMTVDETGTIYRKNADRFEGIVNFSNPREAREMNKLFIEIWERSHVDTEMRSLSI